MTHESPTLGPRDLDELCPCPSLEVPENKVLLSSWTQKTSSSSSRASRYFSTSSSSFSFSSSSSSSSSFSFSPSSSVILASQLIPHALCCLPPSIAPFSQVCCSSASSTLSLWDHLGYCRVSKKEITHIHFFCVSVLLIML